MTDFDLLGNGMGVKSRTHNVSFRHPTSPDLTVSGVASDAHDRFLRLTRLYTNQMALGTAPALAVDGAMFVLHARQPHMGYSSVKVCFARVPWIRLLVRCLAPYLMSRRVAVVAGGGHSTVVCALAAGLPHGHGGPSRFAGAVLRAGSFAGPRGLERGDGATRR